VKLDPRRLERSGKGVGAGKGRPTLDGGLAGKIGHRSIVTGERRIVACGLVSSG
jgi:hypothetical protein